MSAALGSAVLELTADASKLKATIASARASVIGDFKRMGAALKPALIGGLTVAGTAIGAALYRIGAQFDDAYNNIRRGTGATGRTLEGLKRDFRAVAREVPADMGTVSNVIADLNTRLGLTGKPLQERAKQFLELSRITGEDVSTSIRNVTRLFGDWNVRSNRQGRTLDYLFRMSQTTGIGVSDLAGRMTDFGAPLRQLGFDFDTAAAMFGKFEREGVNIQTLMPGLKMAVKNLSEPSRRTAEMLERLGVAGRAPDVALRAVIRAIKDAGSTMEANRMAFAVFGSRAGPDLATAIREGRFELNDLVRDVKNGSDTIDGVGRETMTFSEKLQILRNKGLVLLEPAATAVVDALQHFADWSLKASDTAREWLPKIKRVVSAITGSKGFKAAIDVLASTVRRQITAITQYFRSLFGVVSNIIKTIGALLRGDFTQAWQSLKAIFTNGINMLIGVFKLLTAPIREAASRAFAGVRDAITKPINAAIGWMTTAFTNARNWLTKAWANITKAASSAWTRTRDAIVKPITGAVGAVQKAIDGATKWLSRGWDTIKRTAKAGWERVRDFVVSPIDAARTRVQNIVTNMRTWLTARWEDIKRLTNAAWQRVKDFIGNPINAARERVQNIVGNMRRWLSDRWNDIRSRASNAWVRVRDTITAPITRAKEIIQNVIGGVRRWLSDRWGDIVNGAAKFGKNIKDKLEGAFKGAANGVIGFINGIINAINKIPGIPDIPKIPKFAEGGKIGGRASSASSVGFYAAGGRVTRPLAIVGEEAPRHPEYVIPTNPAYRGRAIGLTHQLVKELGIEGQVPGFFLGGVIGGITKGAGGIFKGIKSGVSKVAGLPIGLLEMGAKWILDMLPSVDDIGPRWLRGFGSYALSKITKWIKDKVTGLFKSDDNEGLNKVKRVAAMGEQADKMARMNTPYLYGGGHNPSFSGPWDCSGAVSAVLHAGGFLSSPMTTDGLKVWGKPGDGTLFTVGVRGSTGRNAHTMMKLGSRYFESGSGRGAGWRPGWSGHFPIHRSAPGFARGGVLSAETLAQEIRDALIPRVLGWGLRRGGVIGNLPYAGSFAGGGIVGGPKGAPAWAVVHGGEHISEGVPSVHLHFADGMEWLRRFVRAEIRWSGEDAHAAYRAGVRP